jgi:DMSO/TMAO reductase YedYZ molybdopterin-dependent catalytic subunit
MAIGGANATGRWFEFTSHTTPIERFYVRNHHPTPRLEDFDGLDPANWTLTIRGGSVSNPVTLSYDDLLKLTSRTIIARMERQGDGGNLFWERQGMMDVTGGSWGLGAIGRAEWEYVPMSAIFGLVGVKEDAKAVLFWSGVDGEDMARPRCMSDIMERPDDIGVSFQPAGHDQQRHPDLPDRRGLTPATGRGSTGTAPRIPAISERA